MNDMTKIPGLKDADLFREAALIGGAWVQADDGATVDVTDPATGEVLGRVPDVTGAQTRLAVEAADRAFQSWRKVPHAERAAALEAEFVSRKLFVRRVGWVEEGAGVVVE